MPTKVLLPIRHTTRLRDKPCRAPNLTDNPSNPFCLSRKTHLCASYFVLNSFVYLLAVTTVPIALPEREGVDGIPHNGALEDPVAEVDRGSSGAGNIDQV